MTSSAGPCLEEDDDGGDELDEFCSLKSGSSGSEFLTPRVESATTSHHSRWESEQEKLLDKLPQVGLPYPRGEGTVTRSPVLPHTPGEGLALYRLGSPKYVVDPRRIFHRCLLHLLICLYIPGAYFADSVLAAYKTQILEYLRIDHERFALLFSLPSLTGVLCGPFGVMVAKYGSTKSALSAATLTCVGSALVVVGLQNRAYLVVLLGRVVFWTFLYILCVVQTVLCYRLFSGSALVAAYGLIIVACRTGGLVGSAFNAVLLSWYQGDVVKAEVAPDINAVLQISFSSAMAAVGLVCAIAFAVLYKGTRTARLVWPLLSRRDVATSELSTSDATQRYSLRTLPALYWVLWLALGLLYAAIFPFETIAVDYYVGDWGMTQQRAGMILSTCPFWSLLSPLFSTVLTSIKRRTTTLLLAFTFITIGLVGQAMRITASPLGYIDDTVVSLELYAQPGVFSITDPDSLGHLNDIVSPVLLTDASVLLEEQRKLYSAAGRAATSSKIAVRAKQLQGADKSAIKGVCSGVIKSLKEVDRTDPTFNFSQLCDKFDFLAEQAQDLDTTKS
ncbi:Major facilitator super domain-containing protein 1 [Perkinsus olseni]|uniref:Major facilitator super domain-containing protein 1 n=1 Tax=Perkinsus olseni TaxID=32597 RepID=A0A7J6Q6G2_PEROL|nr:Major facilitator super domain-containing protein 1 [Perkinsus olseni]